MINKELEEYLTNNILPQYKNDNSGHGIDHIKYVINRCMTLKEEFPNINIDMLYTIAIYHDIAHQIDKDNHEKLSAKIFYEDEEIKKFFNNRERQIIKVKVNF